jgi:hypothetical protein
MPDLAGKGKRVVGTFVLMMGAGAIVDAHAMWIGATVMLLGAAAFLQGALEARRRDVTLTHVAATESPENSA